MLVAVFVGPHAPIVRETTVCGPLGGVGLIGYASPVGPADSSPTSNSATGAAPAPRTGSPIAKDTGLRNLPLHDLAQNQIWCALVALACEITTWAQMLAFTDHTARRWGTQAATATDLLHPRTARALRTRTVLHLPEHAPWAALLISGLTRLRALPAPG